MARPPLDAVFRASGGRVIAALAARFRDLDLAEEAFAESCARAAARWVEEMPRDPAAWLYRTAERAALDLIRRRGTRERLAVEEREPEPTPEDLMASDAAIIPDERLRLIFVCCHPAIAADARAALTLKLVCGLTTQAIARAFLLPETTLAQRLVRAKRKIAAAGIAYDVPGPDAWGERLDAVLSTIEIAYAKAHEDAAGAGRHAGYAAEMLSLTGLLATLVPDDPDVLALAATLRFAEARRPARLSAAGTMIPLSQQDPRCWDAELIADGDRHLRRAVAIGRASPRVSQAAIHQSWCARTRLDEPPPWPKVLRLYDALVEQRDDAVVQLNRLVAFAEVHGAAAALAELDALAERAPLAAFLPYQAVRAGLLSRAGRPAEAIAAYDAALALSPAAAEARWLAARREELLQSSGGAGGPSPTR